jgi:hypothetical protein
MSIRPSLQRRTWFASGVVADVFVTSLGRTAPRASRVGCGYRALRHIRSSEFPQLSGTKRLCEVGSAAEHEGCRESLRAFAHGPHNGVGRGVGKGIVHERTVVNRAWRHAYGRVARVRIQDLGSSGRSLRSKSTALVRCRRTILSARSPSRISRATTIRPCSRMKRR